MLISSKRAEYLSLTSLFLSILFFVITILLGWWSGYFAIYAVSWLIGASGLIWFVLLIQFHQRALAEQEKLDAGQLAGRGEATIFETEGEQARLFAVAQRRLELLEKWFLPVFSVFVAAYQIGIGFYLFRVLLEGSPTAPKQPLICAVAMVAVAFISFLISRYATGLSSEPQWRPLKAGGAIFVGVAVITFGLAIVFAFVYFNFLVSILTVFNFFIPILLVLLGGETALNVILDIYRPRLKEQYGRAAFDSRLLGIINEPGGILHTAAAAIDYQFGFKVSQTWFYKLLEKAIVPLVLFGAASIYLLSAVVVVGPDEQAIVEHFGRAVKDAPAARLHEQTAGVKIYQPGIMFKWPWPIDTAYKYPVNRVMELSIGFVPDIDPKTGQVQRGPKLWGRAHYKEEYQLMVASRQAGGESKEGGTVPVSIVLAAIPVQYKVKDLYSFLYNYGTYEKSDRSRGFQAEKVLESICYQELTRFAAGAKIEVESEADLAHSLLGAGRLEAREELTRSIQKAADKARLGVEIVFVGMQGIHPPIELAEDYQKVVGAIQQKQALILNAEAASNKTLTSLAGSVEKSRELYRLASQYQRSKNGTDADGSNQLSAQIDKAFTEADGQIFAVLRNAQSYAYQKATIARATGERFAGQLKAFRSAPEIYKRWIILNALETSLKNIRKYVLIADKDQYIIQEIDATEKLLPGLMDYGENLTK
jgi:regulator of protease activity HflC (stomatin/prohibitin superfamily)